ncbi:hypothetical protein LSTR_LSTR012268 [Laodelphax striatellus]|uniref:Mediator of RNA polymerase II transcription subunit 11 n=1 Tax=Laodelphax striatellus TaxID=195883 RepID=A0A482WKZ9_LAOST|nr:hypothetical protein LSTR_LSTR012268 [Laodelphax striatellus]
MAGPMEKIQALDSIERDIILCLQSAGQALSELGKEKSSQKQAEGQTQQFLKTLSSVESKLTDQINYLTQVSTGQPHEGSGYASQKVLQMAWHRLEHVRSRVNDLEWVKNKHMQGRGMIRPATVTGQPQQQQQPPQQQQQPQQQQPAVQGQPPS